jgi:hypothetical protein
MHVSPVVGRYRSSFCRPAKGWAPTGVLAHKARKAGYPSVAHYLITTYQREQEESNEGQPPIINAADIKREGKQEGNDDDDDNEEEEGQEGGDGQGAANLEETPKRNEGSETRKRKRDEALLLGCNGAGVASVPRQRRLPPHDSTTAATTSAQRPQHKMVKAESSLPEPYVDLQQLKKDRIVACWADPSSGDTYWLARGRPPSL